MLNVAAFPTYEAELAALEQASGLRIPQLSAGAARALRDSPSWLFQAESKEFDSIIALLPDPSLNLSLPYPEDELALALTRSRKGTPTTEEVHRHAASFSLDHSLMNRPTTALSGGERMLLSLAKIGALQTSGDSLFICSPFFWLDETNRRLVREKFDLSDDFDTRLLVLDGEESSTTRSVPLAVESITWHLEIDDLVVRYHPESFPRVSTGRDISFSAWPSALALPSPTLVEGRNGVGKSTLARVLAGLTTAEQGRARASVRGLAGSARLVLQDTVLQLMGQTVSDYLARVFRFDEKRAERVIDLFDDMQRRCASRFGSSEDLIILGNLDKPMSLLQCKLAISAARLLSDTPLIILDEPGWCLSRNAARALVVTIAEEAHTRGIAVAVISHQRSWWDGIVNAIVQIEATGPDEVSVTHLDTNAPR